MPFPITSKHISLEDAGKVVIGGEGATALINSLIQKPAITLVELVAGATVVDLNAISVDSAGRVVITSQNFTEAVKRRMDALGGQEGDFFDTNCSCGKN